MTRDLKEDFFRLDGAWASFELMSIRRRDDYLKPFRGTGQERHRSHGFDRDLWRRRTRCRERPRSGSCCR
jgi:hypothetical protein